MRAARKIPLERNLVKDRATKIDLPVRIPSEILQTRSDRRSRLRLRSAPLVPRSSASSQQKQCARLGQMPRPEEHALSRDERVRRRELSFHVRDRRRCAVRARSRRGIRNDGDFVSELGRFIQNSRARRLATALAAAPPCHKDASDLSDSARREHKSGRAFHFAVRTGARMCSSHDIRFREDRHRPDRVEQIESFSTRRASAACRIRARANAAHLQLFLHSETADALVKSERGRDRAARTPGQGQTRPSPPPRP